MLAAEIGLMINDLFANKYYWGAGNNLGLILNEIFGGPDNTDDSDHWPDLEAYLF